MKTWKIIIKDEQKLKKYGFYPANVSNNEHVYDLRANRNITLWLRADNGYLQIISASTPSIRVICEMYKDGVIEFAPFVRETRATFQLTTDEVEILKQYRASKQKIR